MPVAVTYPPRWPLRQMAARSGTTEIPAGTGSPAPLLPVCARLHLLNAAGNPLEHRRTYQRGAGADQGIFAGATVSVRAAGRA